jgi:hypothetical protein
MATKSKISSKQTTKGYKSSKIKKTPPKIEVVRNHYENDVVQIMNNVARKLDSLDSYTQTKMKKSSFASTFCVCGCLQFIGLVVLMLVRPGPGAYIASAIFILMTLIEGWIAYQLSRL